MSTSTKPSLITLNGASEPTESSKSRRTYTRQFKQETVARIAGGQSVTEVARSLGLDTSMVWKWKQRLGRKPAVATTFPPSFRTPEADVLEKLAQSLRAVTEERDTLKKALAYFAADQK